MMENDKLSAGLIGCGRIGSRTDEALRNRLPDGWLPLNHAEAIQSLPELSLTAVCDVDSEALSWAAEKYNVSNTFESPRRL